MKFIAIDVETANSDLSSICQIGLASFNEGLLDKSWKSLVNPDDNFDPINISIHGIDDRDVQFSPKWDAVYEILRPILEDNTVVSHTAFDRVSLARACTKYNLSLCNCTWLDSAKIVRRAWPRFARSGYGLSNVASCLGIEYQPHDALEDARCAGEILLRAISETGLNVKQWLDRVRLPIDPSAGSPIVRHGNVEGYLYGEILVFTGSLSVLRSQAADVAALAGCEVDSDVTKRTTMLVVGDQDVRKLAGHERSSKHRKAEDLIAKGQHIHIVSESDFWALVGR